MADKPNIYLDRAKEVLNASHSWRAAHEALCGVHMANTYGSGWAKYGKGTRGGAAVRRLKPITGMRSADIRVSLNKTREKALEIMARLKPRVIDLRVDPATTTRDDMIVAKVAKRRMELFLEPKIPLRKLRRAVEWMVILGSSVIRRTISRRGAETRLYGEDGQLRRDEDKRLMTLRDFRVRWQVGAPHEYCRDPALAHSPDWEGEDCIGHEKPMTTDEVYRTFGVKIQTEMTIGRLMEYNSLLHKWSHGAAGRQLSTHKSQRPAVMVSDWWFRDPTNPEWTKYMIAYRDVLNKDDPSLKPVHPAGPNPYHGLPLHHLFYIPVPGCPWGMGIPACLGQHQVMYDVAVTMFLRMVMTLSGNQLIVNDDALVDKAEDVLDRRLDRAYHIQGQYRASEAISRLQTPQLDQNVMAMLSMVPGWFDDATLTSPVLKGQTSKRGEAGKAVKAKVEQAERPLMTVTDDMEPVVDDALTGTLVDLGHNERMGALKKLFQREIDGRELAVYRAAFKTKRKPIGGVFVSRDSIRPRHPRESREELQEAIESGMIEGEVARWAHGIRTGEWIDPSEGDAYRNQTQEIQAILAGEKVRVATGHKHPVHMKVIDDFMEQPLWVLLPEAKQAEIEDHREEHYDVMRVRALDEGGGAQGETGVQQPPEMMMGSPEAQGFGQQPIPFPAQQAPPPALAGPGALPMLPGAPVAGPAEMMTAM